jgi:hypothetical protein
VQNFKSKRLGSAVILKAATLNVYLRIAWLKIHLKVIKTYISMCLGGCAWFVDGFWIG